MATARYTDEQWNAALKVLKEYFSKKQPEARLSINPWRAEGVYTVFAGGKAAGRFFMEDLAKGLVKAK